MNHDKRLIELERKQLRQLPNYEDWTIELVGVNEESKILKLVYCNKSQKLIFV